MHLISDILKGPFFSSALFCLLLLLLL